MKKLKTIIFNDTHHAFNIKIGAGYRDRIELLPMMPLVVDTPDIYDTFDGWEFFLSRGTSSSIPVLSLESIKIKLAKEIRIFEFLDSGIEFRVSKVHRRHDMTLRHDIARQNDLRRWHALLLNEGQEELDEFDAAQKHGLTSMRSLERSCANMEELLKQVIVFHSQCHNLVRILLKGIHEVRSMHAFKDENLMWTFYQSRKLRDLFSSVDSLVRALISAEQLLQACSGKEWRRVALVLSMAPPELELYSGSSFFLLICDFNWSLEKIMYMTEAPQRSNATDSFASEEGSNTLSSGFLRDQDVVAQLKFKWINQKCRYVLHRSRAASGLTIGATIDEGRMHEDNVDEQASERKGAMRVATDAVELREDDVDQQAFNCKDEIGVAAAEEESLEGDFERQALDRKHLLVNIGKNVRIHTHGNPFLYVAWQLFGNRFGADETSNNKFSAVISNRCEDTSGLCSGDSVSKCFEIQHSDLKKRKLISQGGSKRIYSANWLGLEVAVAEIQHIPRDVVEKEAGFLVKLHHPNVVDFFGFAVQEEALTDEEKNAVEKIEPKWTGYLVMELMQEDLRSLIDKLSRGLGTQDSGGPFSLSVTIDILLQIVAAMIHAQKFEVLHRDLKAKNCLVSSKLVRKSDAFGVGACYYTVKLIDFGESKLWSKDGKHTLKKGTVRWMAPEVWESSEYSGSADVYSFGMTCYEIVTGLIPFQGIRGHQVMEQVCKGIRPTIPISCPASLGDFMEKCWAHAPEQRPSFEAIQEDLWKIKFGIEVNSWPTHIIMASQRLKRVISAFFEHNLLPSQATVF